MAEAHAESERRGLEGIVAKEAGSPYVGGRSRRWIKVKNWQQMEARIIGFMPEGDDAIEKLLIALPGPDGMLTYCGSVELGFRDGDRQTLRKGLSMALASKPCVTNPPRRLRRAC